MREEARLYIIIFRGNNNEFIYFMLLLYEVIVTMV